MIEHIKLALAAVVAIVLVRRAVKRLWETP